MSSLKRTLVFWLILSLLAIPAGLGIGAAGGGFEGER